MPLQATSGAASYDAFGGGVPVVPAYIEEVFSTYLYTGTGSAQTITNEIDLSGKGGLVWIKNRSATSNHVLGDTARNANYSLASNLADAETYNVGGIFSSFNSNGFSIGTSSVVNASGNNFTSWSFRKSNKFYTQTLVYHSNGTPSTVDLSSLGTVGAVLVKSTNVSGDWYTWHRSLTAGNNIRLNANVGQSATNAYLSVSGTTLTISSAAPDDFPYVVYAFAHDAGGFGLLGTDNVISCGAYTGNGTTNNSITLGYEPQWLLVKKSSGTAGWFLLDSMRGLTVPDMNDAFLFPASNDAEDATIPWFAPSATGFSVNASHPNVNENGSTYIYIAIRRGPMKVPTSGTSVYTMAFINPSSANNTNFVTSGFPVDLWMTITATDPFADPFLWMPRLTTLSLSSASTNAESSNPYTNVKFDGNTGMMNRTGTTGSSSLTPNWMFQRAPSFFDVVCYTGTGANRTVTHNLGAVPELLIVKVRTGSSGESWTVWNKTIAASNAASTLWLNSTSSVNLLSNRFNSTAPTSSVFSVGNDGATNGSAWTYVAYLFATCAGVSKVGSYTGTGATQTINCGFTGGARFVMVKRTDSTGGWYVWDTTRGMVSGTDPSKLWNTSAAQVNANSVFTIATGFEIVSTAADINASAGSYIFLAIA